MQRRHLVLAGASLLALPVLGRAGLAQETRDNPMPDDLRQSLERDPTAPVLGNPQGDITLTEFFDYNCPFCRKMVEPMHRLITSDRNLRVVFREWPVFGEDSDFAARASLASLQQGRYWQMHRALFRTKGRVTEAATMRAARDVGLDTARLERDMAAEPVERHISMSHMLAEHMGLIGTPTFVAGDEGAFGEYSLDDLRGLVRRARETMG
ncbi:DsbA family protein [Paracoccus denitrificans]|jgi:protein-disulfide isomerase|uniref:Transcriptional regulator, Fis family n=1 Tax=Paracoccus denitrificans (strain Pd 1222) TaxID=318586 RepID=A1BC05_PARDP|nr:DsbA family protein [Paracoccus denitrificans]ABL73049.1 transcriptional regulator, Fis family [Paracoccus denitrificans PD1222]MBB4628424.1 protein-disulfide isomerase [Paracoccus denitrificans]MCU7429636.1 DsbA family protein [Paracoccus denitrificans]QAR29441.1 DsbA family protein [Paracoccus denitrificans]UPV98230.1 DsbA family protein [Paracoccus denitrificans]